jgi:hypothetical protein
LIRISYDLPHPLFSLPHPLPSQRHPRSTMHVSKLNTEARWGDLVLFKINPDIHSHLSSSSSHAPSSCCSCWEWDHVGLVVLSQSEFSSSRSGDQQSETIIDDSNASLDLLELTSEGVTLYPLTGRLRAYNYHNVSQITDREGKDALSRLFIPSLISSPALLVSISSCPQYVRYMGLRKLRGFPRKMETASKLNEFISSVLGKPLGGKNRKGQVFLLLPSPLLPSDTISTSCQQHTSPKSFSIFSTFSDDNEIGTSVHELIHSPSSDSDPDSSLNAEFIASALKVLGIIPKYASSLLPLFAHFLIS